MTSFQPSQPSPFRQTDTANISKTTKEAQETIKTGSVKNRIQSFQATKASENVDPNVGAVFSQCTKKEEDNKKRIDPSKLGHSKFTNESNSKKNDTPPEVPPKVFKNKPSDLSQPELEKGKKSSTDKPALPARPLTRKQRLEAPITEKDITDKKPLMADPDFPVEQFGNKIDKNNLPLEANPVHSDSIIPEKYTDKNGNDIEKYGDYEIFTPRTTQEKIMDALPSLSETKRKIGNIKDNLRKMMGFKDNTTRPEVPPEAPKINRPPPPSHPPRLVRGENGQLHQKNIE